MDESQPTTLQMFSRRVADAARAAGYDIDSPRGGGKKALAQASGMSHATVSRMLAGLAMPDPYGLERLAGALRMSLVELLVESGLVSSRAALRPDRCPHCKGEPPAGFTCNTCGGA